MNDVIVKLVPTSCIRDLPQGLVMNIEVGDYTVKISTRDETNIVIEYVADGRWGLVRLVNPDPDTRVIDIIKEAQALIEKFMEKRKAEA